MERRELFKTCGRLLGLGALAAGGAHLVTRSTKDSDHCTGDSVCSRCGEWQSCGHPTALSMRLAREKR